MSSPLYQTRTCPHCRRGHTSKLWLYQHSVESDKNVMRWECSKPRAFKKIRPLTAFSAQSALWKPDSSQAIIKCAVHTVAFTLVEKILLWIAVLEGLDGQEVVKKAITTVQWVCVDIPLQGGGWSAENGETSSFIFFLNFILYHLWLMCEYRLTQIYRAAFKAVICFVSNVWL